MMKIRIKFRKYGTMKFIGHLDVMRYFQKAIRRSEVNIRYSEGFSPHQIMSFAAPLGVGITSKGEYVDIEVLDTENSKKMIDRLNAVMSEGFEILEYKLLPDDAANAMSIVAVLFSALVMNRKRKARKNGLRNWSVFLTLIM